MYAKDNSYRYTDPDGRFFGIDDAVGFVVGGIIGAGIEAIKAEASGERITAGSVAGAFVAGGIAGVGVVNVPETGGASIVIAGATNGAIAAGAGDATKQAVDIATGDQKNFSSRELAVNTAVGAVVGGGG